MRSVATGAKPCWIARYRDVPQNEMGEPRGRGVCASALPERHPNRRSWRKEGTFLLPFPPRKIRKTSAPPESEQNHFSVPIDHFSSDGNLRVNPQNQRASRNPRF